MRKGSSSPSTNVFLKIFGRFSYVVQRTGQNYFLAQRLRKVKSIGKRRTQSGYFSQMIKQRNVRLGQ